MFCRKLFFVQMCCPVPLPQNQERLLLPLSELGFPSVSVFLSVSAALWSPPSVPELLLELLLALLLGFALPLVPALLSELPSIPKLEP